MFPHLTAVSDTYSRTAYYKLKTMSQTFTEPEIRYTLYPLELRQDDIHRMQEDSNHIPVPQLRPFSAMSFNLPADTRIV